MLVLKLLHGRHRPDEILNDWGPSGPCLIIDWFHVTYFATFCLGLEKDNKGCEGEFFIDEWIPGKQSGMLVEGLLHYDGMFYGDWEIFETESAEGTQPFGPEAAEFPSYKHWHDIPKREECEYGEAT